MNVRAASQAAAAFRGGVSIPQLIHHRRRQTGIWPSSTANALLYSPIMLRLVVLTICVASLAAAQEPLRFELKQIKKTTPGCVMTFEYPEIISAASPQARDRMNAGILRVLLRQSSWPANDSGTQSLEAYANEFLGYCTEFQKQPHARDLYQHKRVAIFRYTPPILSFRCDADEDGGGVHPFGTTLFINFESSTGKIVTVKDLLKEGDLPKLQSIAETRFRSDHKLSAAESLSEQSYNFPNDRFRLNDNFGIGERNLVFLFNTYEIGPGAMGSTKITIPYVFVRDLLKPELHLW